MILKKSIRFYTLIIMTLLYKEFLFASKWTAPRENAPTLKMGIVGSSFSLDIDDPEGKSKPPIQYRPNTMGRTAIGIEYLGAGLTIGFTQSSTQENETRYGKTTGIDYQFRFLREENSFDLFYQKYSGFYIANSKDIDPTIQGNDPLIQRSDLHSEHMGLQYYRTLNPENLSLAACFDQSGWQKESGGSWFLYSAFDQHHIDSDASLIPSQVSSSYPTIQEFQGGNFTSAKLGFGGAYAFVYNHFYVAGKLIIAGGQQKQSYTLGAESINRIIPTAGGNAKISFGYNGDAFFSSFNLFNDTTDITLRDRRLRLGTLELSLFLGLHL